MGTLRCCPPVGFVSLSTRSPVPTNACVTIPYSLHHPSFEGTLPRDLAASVVFLAPNPPQFAGVGHPGLLGPRPRS